MQVSFSLYFLKISYKRFSKWQLAKKEVIDIYDENYSFLRMWILNIKLRNYHSLKKPEYIIKIIIIVGMEDNQQHNLKANKNSLWKKLLLLVMK